MTLELQEIGFHYRSGEQILNNCCHTFENGITALVGANGAGKTTLLRLLASLLKPKSGQINYCGHSIHTSASKLAEYRKLLGWLPQQASLAKNIVAIDYLRYLCWLKQIPSHEAETTIINLAQQLEVEQVLACPMRQLSGGTRRRVTLAGAMLGSPKVLLLDEPSVGLDPTQRQAFLNALTPLSSKCIIILSTHILEDVFLAANSCVTVADKTIKSAFSIDALRAQDSLTLELLRSKIGM